jgi:hypothetical protein
MKNTRGLHTLYCKFLATAYRPLQLLIHLEAAVAVDDKALVKGVQE